MATEVMKENQSPSLTKTAGKKATMGGGGKNVAASSSPKAELQSLLQESSRSKAVHGRCEKRALALFKESAELFTEAEAPGGMLEQLRRVLIVKKKDAAVDRLIGFVTRLAAKCLATGSSSEEDDLDDYSAPRAFVSTLLRELARFSGVQNATVRQRSCELIARTLEAIAASTVEDGADLETEDWDLLVVALLPRLRDKVAAVRAHACVALCRLQDEDDEDADLTLRADPTNVTAALLAALQCDGCAEVRRAAVYSIEPSKQTLLAILKRTRDVDSGVRAAAYETICKKVSCKSIKEGQRVALLRHGLKDRDPRARAAATAMLARWFVSNNLKAGPARLIRNLGGAEGVDNDEAADKPTANSTARLALRALHAAAVALTNADDQREARDVDDFKKQRNDEDFDAAMFFVSDDDENAALKTLEAALNQADEEDDRRESTGRNTGRKSSLGGAADSRSRLISAMLGPLTSLPETVAELGGASEALALRSRVEVELRPSVPKLRAGPLQEALGALSTASRLNALLTSAAEATGEEAGFVASQLLDLAKLAVNARLMDESSSRSLAETIQTAFVANATFPTNLAEQVGSALYAARPEIDAHLPSLFGVDSVRALYLATAILGSALKDKDPAAFPSLEAASAQLETDFFLPALESPEAATRTQGVIGLGRRLYTSSEAATRLSPGLTVIAVNEKEVVIIRFHALQALCDAAVLYGQCASSDVDTTLKKLINGSNKALGNVAAESAARLLVHNSARRPEELLAQLALLYVTEHEQEEDDEEEEEAGEKYGSFVRRDQVLAAFFPSVLNQQHQTLLNDSVKYLLNSLAAADCVVEDDLDETKQLAKTTSKALSYLLGSSSSFTAQYELCYAVLDSTANGAETHLEAARALCGVLGAQHPQTSTLLGKVAHLTARYIARRLGGPAAKAVAKFAERCATSTSEEAPAEEEEGAASEEQEDARGILRTFTLTAEEEELPGKSRAAKRVVAYDEPSENDIPRQPRKQKPKKKKAVVEEEEEEDDADVEEEDDDVCLACGSAERPESFLLCDGCDSGGYHLACLDPPLAAVPEGDWFCPVCAKEHDAPAAPAPAADDDQEAGESEEEEEV